MNEQKLIIIQDTIVQQDIFESYFACQLSACKGACCHEGDLGAPIEQAEVLKLEDRLDDILVLLSEESQDKIQEEGVAEYFPEIHQLGTQLLDNGACVFMIRENGVALCGIEAAQRKDPTIPDKPLSCQLYPIRIHQAESNGMTILKYNRWSICSPACANGKELGIPLFRFVSNGLKKMFGKEYYDMMETHYENYFHKA